MSLPASVIVPELGSSRPATIRSVVVLPQPDGPSRAKNEPRGTSRSRSRTAWKAPKCLVSLRRARPSYDAGSAGAPASGAWASTTCDIRELSFVLGDLLFVERHERHRLREHVVVREDQRVVDEVGVDLLHLLARALDRTDVVDPRGEPRGDVGLVVVVHPLLGVRLVLGAVRHQHVVAPEHQP